MTKAIKSKPAALVPLASRGRRTLYIKSFARIGAWKSSSRPAALENTAQGVLCARNHCSAVLRSHWPLEIAARACREATWRSKSLLEHAFSCSATVANDAPALALRGRSSSKRRWIRQHFRVHCGFPFEIALLRTLHCFELCFARLHRHRQVPYANLVYSFPFVSRIALP